MGGKPRQKPRTLHRTRVKLDFVVQHTGDGILHFNWLNVIGIGLKEYTDLEKREGTEPYASRAQYIEGGAKISESVARPATCIETPDP
jgi:hypothetical protein